jgi:NTE family protein
MKRKVVTLALQGGGSHGAFTWGVLDRLLEDERIEIEGVSGASAGAMNAVMLAHGLTVGGRDGARQALKDFWEGIASKAPLKFMPENLLASNNAGTQTSTAPVLDALFSMARFYSPYQLNPFDINPLRDILASQVDFERIRSESTLKLFIAATQVSTGTLRLFGTKQITIDVLLASACLPTLHHAIRIDEEDYWDGGLTANPPVFPLIQQCSARDIIVVILHSCRRQETPTKADDISRRLTEISFSSAFFTEFQGLARGKREAERSLFSFGRLERRLRNLNMHVIDSQELVGQLSALSKINTHPAFIKELHDEGRERAGLWLEENFRLLGVRSSFSLDAFLR